MTNRTTDRGPNAGHWQPGQSGNPGGRPRGADLAEIARRYTPDAIRALVHVARGSYQHGARVAAAKELLDRGWGKAPQELNLTGGGMTEALHLHLYAVQRVEQQRHVAAELEAPILEAAVDIPDEVLPAVKDDLMETALPLWDAARSAARDDEDKPEGDNAAQPGEPP